MKKLTLGLLALALALPVGAEAKQPPKKPKKPTTQQSATKNAAWMCKSLRAANPTAFNSVFGSAVLGGNHNGRNAYGKCVSAHARTKHETGRVCEVGVTGTNVAHTFTGTFTVTGGTGFFAGTTGSGTATFTQQPGATNALGGTVNAAERFTSLNVHV